MSQDNVFFRANLTNRPLPELGEQAPPEGAIHVERTRFLWDRRLYERLALTNYAERAVRSRCSSTSPPTSPTCSRCAATCARERGRTLARRRSTMRP